MDRRTRLSFQIVSWHRRIQNCLNICANIFLSRISEYAVASTESAAFIIGGYESGSTVYDTIAKFQENQWTRYGSLKASRRLHGSITSGDLSMIIGGDSSA